MSDTKIIHGSLDEIVEAVKDEYGKMFHPQEGVKWHPLLEEIVRTALERFVQPNEWISVEDRLPESGKDYLVTDGDACMVAAFRLESKKWDFWKVGWWSSDQVTHWMPLPEPPKKGGDDE